MSSNVSETNLTTPNNKKILCHNRKMSLEAENLLAQEYLDWMNRDGNFFCKDFCKEHGLLKTWPGKVAMRNPVWRQAIQQANEIRAKKVKFLTCRFRIDENGKQIRIGRGGSLKGHCKGITVLGRGFQKGHKPYPGAGGKHKPSQGFQKGHPYLGGAAGSLRLMSIEEENKLADELVEWMKKDENLLFRDFFSSKKVTPSWVDDVLKRNLYFRESYLKAKEIQEPKSCRFPGGRPRSMSLEEENDLSDELIEWMKKDGNIFFQEFFLEKNLYSSWINKIADRNPYVNESLLIAKEIQETKLMKGGLLDPRFNVGMAKFILVNRHKDNFAEKTETKVTGTLEHTASVFLSNADGKTKDLIDEEKI